MLVVNNGNFGNRWVKMSQAYGLEVTEIRYEWGEKADNEDVRKAREIFDGFSDEMKKALQTGSLDKVNEVLGNMKVEEAEELVGLFGEVRRLRPPFLSELT